MDELSRERIDAMIALLRHFPADGQLRNSEHGDAGYDLVAYNFVERIELQKPCRTCGTERFDHAFFRITGAGRAILALADQSND